MLRNKTLIKIMSFALLIAFLTVSILTVLPAFNANAKTAQEKVNESVKKQGEIKQQINETKQKKEANMAVKEEIDREVTELQKKIDVLVADIDESNKKIAKKTEELNIAQENCDKQYDAYCARAEILLDRGSVSYLEIIIKADSFSDFITRLTLIREITEYDNNRLKELKAYVAEVEELKKELEKENEKLVSLKKDEDSKMSVLAQKQAESQAIIDKLSGDIDSFESALAAQERAESAARAEIARLVAAAEAAARQKSQASAKSSSSSSSSSSSAASTGGAMAWPSASTRISSPYGTRVHPVTGKIKTHAGLDIDAAHGTNVYAAQSGTVIVAGWNSGGYGNYVVIDHGGGLSTLYAHCSSLNVSTGQSVSKGQVIAKCGSTGLSTGPHVHFEVLRNGSHTDPMAYLR